VLFRNWNFKLKKQMVKRVGGTRWNFHVQLSRQQSDHLLWNERETVCKVSRLDKATLYNTGWLYRLSAAQLQLQQNGNMYQHPAPYKLVRWYNDTLQFIAEFSPTDRSCVKLTFLTHIQQQQPLVRSYAGWMRAVRRARVRILAKRMVSATPLMLRDLAHMVALYACELHSQYAVAPTYLEALQRLNVL